MGRHRAGGVGRGTWETRGLTLFLPFLDLGDLLSAEEFMELLVSRVGAGLDPRRGVGGVRGVWAVFSLFSGFDAS